LHKAALVDLGPEGAVGARRVSGRFLAGTSINGDRDQYRDPFDRLAWGGFAPRRRREEQGAHISFDSVDLLWNT
jgi:hypothetical protein